MWGELLDKDTVNLTSASVFPSTQPVHASNYRNYYKTRWTI